MHYYPLIIALIFAVLDWIAVEKRWNYLEYVMKPATMLALIGWMWVNTGLSGPMLWFSLGAILCLVGDIFLMIPRDMFIFGLLAFLIGHIFYIVGFNDEGPYLNFLGIIFILILGVYVGWFYPKLVQGLKQRNKNELVIPVLIYALVISVMVYSAMMTSSRNNWSDGAALTVSLGAILFYASDSILAWDRFVKHSPNGRLLNLMTYHLGQMGIILGAILHTL